MTTLTKHKNPNEFFEDSDVETEPYNTNILMGNEITIKNMNFEKGNTESLFDNLKRILNRQEDSKPIVFVDYWADLKPNTRKFFNDMPSLEYPLFLSIEERLNETNSLVYAQTFLTTLSKECNLGEIKLIIEDDDSCLPTFNIKTPKSLSADERIELSDKIFNSLHDHYEKLDKLNDLKNFFFRLDFEE